VFSEAALRQATEFSYARSVKSTRGAQDLVYRMFAVAAIELYQEAYSEEGAPLSWLLAPQRRHTLLSELGRTAKPRSDAHGRLVWREEDVSSMISAALEIAATRPSTKDGVARIRELRQQP
jgi:hypothetical protein